MFIDDLNVGIRFDIGSRNNTRRGTFHRNNPSRIAVVLNNQRLDVKNDFSQIFQNTWQRREFVLSSTDLNLGNGTPLQAGQQHTTQAIAYGRTKATFERLRRPQTYRKLVTAYADQAERRWAVPIHAT